MNAKGAGEKIVDEALKTWKIVKLLDLIEIGK